MARKTLNNYATGAQTLINCLKVHGVKYIFGIPGAAIMPLLEVLRKDQRSKDTPRFIVTRHEQNAAFMAQSYGRITETPGVCLATAGPGATNLLSGVATATADRDPLVAITGETPRAEHFKKTHQTIRTATLFRPITKWSEEIQAASAIPEAVARAFRIANTPHEGATNLTVPIDVLTETSMAQPLEPLQFSFGQSTASLLQQAVELLHHAKHPVVLAGYGATRKKTNEALRVFVKKTCIPVVATFEAAGVLSRSLLDSFIGRVGLKAREPGDIALAHADCVITIGYDPIEYSPLLWSRPNLTLIHIDELPADPEELYQPKIELLGESAKNLAVMTDICDSKFTIHKEARRAQKILFSQINQKTNGGSLKPLTFLSELRSIVTDDTTVVSDVGSHQIWLAKYFFSFEPRHLLFSMGFQTMGVALPWAIGATFARPGKPVISLSGDGSFLMSVMELETAVRLKCPITHIVWRDGSYNLVGIQQQEAYKKTFGVRFGNPDIVALAKSFGAAAFRVTKPSQIRSTIKKAITLKRPCVIDVPIDYSKNLSLLKPKELLTLS